LCLAVFLGAQVMVSLVVSALSLTVFRWAEHLPAARAANALFGLRLLPSIAGALLVLLVCVPSYLRFEPRGAIEEVGPWCLAGAVLCLLRIARAIGRTGRAALRASRCSPNLALLGILRPRLIVSAAVRRELSVEEMSAALAHERAHCESRDNLKRLILLLIPGPIALERAWFRFAEWAADDRAAAGDPRRSLALAAALVRVARLTSNPMESPLMSSLIAGGCDLEERVNRLLDERPSPSQRISIRFRLVAGLAAALGLLLLTCAGTLGWSHSLLESWMH
jgi:beta-lactamase regulating signal transducer with metallopeptidase domain